MCLAWEEALFSEPERGDISAEPERRSSVLSIKGVPLYPGWEEALFSEPKRRPSLLSPRRNTCAEPGRRPSVTSLGRGPHCCDRTDAPCVEFERSPVTNLRGGPVFLAREEVLSAEPERRPTLPSPRGDPLCRA